ncbi:MAG: glycosyltransferase family 9 protein [Candidatus Goldbacteria bacterium]|nr:glycosyltransferase family 9 protein [Candidatus Goldiibacteriota bacterium]
MKKDKMADKIGRRIEKGVKIFFINFLSFIIPADSKKKLKPIGRIKSVLVIRPDRLGDFILTVPAIQLLKKNLPPGAKLTILCGERGLDIAKMYFPEDRIILRKKGILNFKMCVLKTAFRHDAVINFHSYPFSMTSAMLTLFTFCGGRVGFKETEKVKVPLARKIYNKGIVLNDDAMHETKKNYMLLSVFGITAEKETLLTKPAIDGNVKTAVNEYYTSLGLTKKPVIIHPTLMKKDNRWEKERYIQFAKMAAEAGLPVIAVSGMGEDTQMEEFKMMSGDLKGIHYFPYRKIHHLMALAEKAACVVCNDSGIMHALSLVSPVLAVFGPSVLSRWKPIGPFNNYCFQKDDGMCMSVTAEEVIIAVKKYYGNVN